MRAAEFWLTFLGGFLLRDLAGLLYRRLSRSTWLGMVADADEEPEYQEPDVGPRFGRYDLVDPATGVRSYVGDDRRA